MTDTFDDLLKDPAFGMPDGNNQMGDASQASGPPPGPSPFEDIAKEAVKPPPGDPSIWNALPRGISSLKQGGHLSWFSAQRLAGQAPDPSGALDAIASGEEFDKLYPKTPGELDAEQKFFKENDWSQLLNPRFIASTALESLPTIAGPVAGSVAGGLAGSLFSPAGTAIGTFAGAGAGSGLVDYGAAYKDYLTKKIGQFDRQKWDAAFRSDPNLLDEAHQWAAKHSGMVAAFDLAGIKVGGILAKPALAAGTSLARRAGAVGAGVATEGVTETLGESTGTALASGGEDWNVKEAVLGGVAASATGGVHSFIEPVMGKITGHGEPKGALTDPKIEAAFQSFTGQQPVEAAQPDGTIIGQSQRAEAPIWRSALRDLVDVKGPSFADPQQWINTIRNAPGVKNEEIEYTGVENWLRGQTGRVSKQDVMAEIEANQVDVREVKLQHMPDLRNIPPNEIGSTILASQGQPRFPKHVLPGGENYKELLLTLPADEKPLVIGDNNTFTSSHYPGVPNILAHVRFNERIDGDGQKALHLEEVQSDWHQQGREVGYSKGPAETARLAKEMSAARDHMDEVFHEVRRTGADDPINDSRVVDAERAFRTIYREWAHSKNATPDAPFKSTWHELAFKRMLRYAADNGFSRITWTPAVEQIRRYQGRNAQGVDLSLSAEQQRGMREFYDKILPSVAKKWAKRFGGSNGNTMLAVKDNSMTGFRSVEVPYVDVPAAASGVIQRGLPVFNRTAPDSYTSQRGLLEMAGTSPAVRSKIDASNKLFKALVDLKNLLKLDVNVRVHLENKVEQSYGNVMHDGNNGYIINVNLAHHTKASELWATMVHELGHIVFYDKFSSAKPHVQMAIRAEFEAFRAGTKLDDKLESVFLRRDNAISIMQRQGSGQMPLYSLTPEQRQYWAGFDEWAAEQVVKWATTDVRPLTIVEKWFKNMGHYIINILEAAMRQFSSVNVGMLSPTLSVQTWLNSFIDAAPEMGSRVYEAVDSTSKEANQRATADESPYVEASPQTFATQPTRRAMETLFHSMVPPQVTAMAAQADKINKFTELMISVQQLAAQNPQIRSLQLYKEDVALWQLEKQTQMDEAMKTLKMWRKIRGPQADAVSSLIDEMMNMTYLKAGEHGRKPTQVEFEAMVRRLGVNDAGLAVFTKITQDFDNMLTKYQQLLHREAAKIIDPISQFAAITDVNAKIARMRRLPYFPSMRFGQFTLTVRDANGKVMHFETFKNKRHQEGAMRAIMRQGVARDNIYLNVLPQDARPLLGMPPGLLQMIGEKLSLSPTQKEVLEQLRFELSPQQSFKHRFQRKRLVKGYSTDFQRAYANYMFHGANHFARMKYADQLRDHVRDVRDQAKFMNDGRLRTRVGNFMADHLANVLDPKPDFTRLRSLMFMWALAFSPAAAGVNLTQTMVISYPYLASKFGDAKAMKAMLSAGARVSTFYRKGTYETLSGAEMEAINEAVKEGTISEAMAPEMAAISEGRNLGKGWGGNVAERAWQKFAEMGSWMFEMAEQTNRRIVFRAAFNLAMANPGARHVRETVATNTRQYDRLRTAGWTVQQASAYVVAKQATEATQYQYSAAAQPRFMRGKWRTVFVFKSFVQNTMFFLWNYPAAAVRSMLIMGFLGGLMGIPGADDLKDILKVIAYNFFGKNFNLETEARKFVMDIAGGHIDPDTLLHGLARRGYGIPAVVDMLGGTVGVNVPYPSLDRSRAVGIGNISPLPLAPMFGPPNKDESRGISDSVQKASGAAFGLGFNIVKAVTDSQLNATDPKRWEKAMPRALASLSRSYRAFSEGGERNRSGAQVLKFDVNDTEQMMEALAMAGGYTPTRLSQKWDKILAQQEFTQFWTLRKQGILKQVYDAMEGNDGDEVARAFEAKDNFNKELPDAAKDLAITDKSVEKSMAARSRSRKAQETGVPVQRSQRGIAQEFDRLYPSVVDTIKR